VVVAVAIVVVAAVKADQEQQQQQQEFINQCNDAVSVANANGDEFLTVDEFSAHVQAWTAAVCPGTEDLAGALAPEDYYDAATVQDFFATLSCALCFGLLDPNNPSAASEGDSETCGCTSDSNTVLPIHIPAQTAVEANIYCALTYELVFVPCAQPVLACHAACQADRDTCSNTQCAVYEGRADYAVQCLQTCDPLFYPCVQACDTVVTNDFNTDNTDGDNNGNDSSSSSSSRSRIVFSFWICLLWAFLS